MSLKKLIWPLLLITFVACSEENNCEKKVVYLKDNDEYCNHISDAIQKNDNLYKHWDNEYSSMRFFLDKYFDLRDSGFSLDEKMSIIRLGEKDFVLYSKDEKKSIAWSSICNAIAKISPNQLVEINRLEDEINDNHPTDSLTAVYPIYLLTWKSDRTINKYGRKAEILQVYSHRAETDSLEKELTRYLNEIVFANCEKKD